MQDEQAIRQLITQQTAAMLAADVEALDAMLSDGFVLTHISGYQQPKAEWLSHIASGQMQYHSSKDRAFEVTIEGDAATAWTRVHMDATIYGSRHTWPLESTLVLTKTGDTWLIQRSTVTTFQ